MSSKIYSSTQDILFGDLMQCKLIMERNFGGKQFMIPAKNGMPKIDVMFFPATYGDEVQADFSDQPQEMYLNLSTIVMCNPNALVYQWMITSANAYWLDFFLRRDCNVLIWNYRGYGQSEQSMFSPNLTPVQQMLDAERVMQFLINNLKVRGSIGVYGRSIGGIAATHLCAKFPDIVEVFVGDRTMGKFQNIVEKIVTNNRFLIYLFNMWSQFQKIDNS